MRNLSKDFVCTVHGSLSKSFATYKLSYDLLANAGINILAPKRTEIADFQSGFAYFENDDIHDDKRLVELRFISAMNQLTPGEGFCYFVNPSGYIGPSASYELAIAQMKRLSCYFLEKPHDLPTYIPENSVWEPYELISYIKSNNELPKYYTHEDSTKIAKLQHTLFESEPDIT